MDRLVGRLGGRRRTGRRSPVAAAALCLVAAFAWGGCATHRAAGVKPAPPRTASQSLESYIGKVRAVSAAAAPTRAGSLFASIEASDLRLAAALRDLAAEGSAVNHRRVGQEYRRVGVLDMAHRHFTAAVQLDPADAASFDALARIWRDWGVPHLGLADAYRAVDLAPASATAVNTVGTLLAAAGSMRQAREWYARALLLDPQAEYALNNLCYAELMLGRSAAMLACHRAAALAPASPAIRNNLGLAFAAEGDFDRARAQFEAAGEAGSADFNMGIVYMAKRDFRRAAAAFDAALRARPGSTLTARRAQQARNALDTPVEPTR